MHCSSKLARSFPERDESARQKKKHPASCSNEWFFFWNNKKRDIFSHALLVSSQSNISHTKWTCPNTLKIQTLDREPDSDKGYKFWLGLLVSQATKNTVTFPSGHLRLPKDIPSLKLTNISPSFTWHRMACLSWWWTPNFLMWDMWSFPGG